MSSLLQIYRINRDDTSNAGIVKKCKAQHAAFKKLGFAADMLWLSNEGVLLNDELIFRQSLRSHSLAMYWFYISRFAFVILKHIDFKKYDAIYFRHPFFDPSLVYLLRQAKRINPAIRIILEINTWPYDQEPDRLLHLFSLRMDKYYRSQAHQFVDAIAHYGQEEQIWGIPVIPVRNGIDVEAVLFNNKAKLSRPLQLIAIGNWKYWHGLDRLIKGLAEFKKGGGKGVALQIVGEGSEIENLKKLIDELDLVQEVKCTGESTGKRLDEIFKDADLGVGTLGLHRKGVALDSSLKHREYCARGLPLILSSPDRDFPAQLDFVHYVAADESDVDIKRVLSFFQELYTGKAEFRKDIRKYAIEHLGWEQQLEPVVRWVEQSAEK